MEEKKLSAVDLLDYINKIESDEVARTYNKISNMLYENFGIQSAETSLLCFYIHNELQKESG